MVEEPGFLCKTVRRKTLFSDFQILQSSEKSKMLEKFLKMI